LYLPFALRKNEGNIVATKKKERYWKIAGARKKHSCLQYDSFMRIRGGIRELLEMLLPSHAAYSFFIHCGLMGGCNQSSVKRTEAKLQWG
jgi:hypothetical protein